MANVMQDIRHWQHHLWQLAVAGAILLTSQLASAADHAVILMYHRLMFYLKPSLITENSRLSL